MDKAARALQLGRCVAHTGDVFRFEIPGLGSLEWPANVQPEAAPNPGKRNAVIKSGRLQLTGARSVFACLREPRVGEDLRDEAGNLYSIAEIPPDPLNPLLILICTVTFAASTT
jgi:hypothetical protein